MAARRRAQRQQAELRGQFEALDGTLRRDVEDAAGAGAVAHRKAAAVDVQALDRARVDRTEQALEILEMKRIEQRHAVVTDQQFVARGAAHVGPGGGVGGHAGQRAQCAQRVVDTARDLAHLAQAQRARRPGRARIDGIAAGVDRHLVEVRAAPGGGAAGAVRAGVSSRCRHHDVAARANLLQAQAMRCQRCARERERVGDVRLGVGRLAGGRRPVQGGLFGLQVRRHERRAVDDIDARGAQRFQHRHHGNRWRAVLRHGERRQQRRHQREEQAPDQVSCYVAGPHAPSLPE